MIDIILFPSSYFSAKQVDEALQYEYDAALATGLFEIALFSYDKFISEGKLILNKIPPEKCNAVMRGWMMKPEQYKLFYGELLKNNIQLVTSPEEYELNTARNHIKTFLQGDTVRPKKYFYALRPILACLWVLENKTSPPVLFDELTAAVLPDALRTSLDYLLDIKINSPEKAEIKPIKDIDVFLNDSVIKFDEIMKNLPKEDYRSWDLLNEFFISELDD